MRLLDFAISKYVHLPWVAGGLMLHTAWWWLKQEYLPSSKCVCVVSSWEEGLPHPLMGSERNKTVLGISSHQYKLHNQISSFYIIFLLFAYFNLYINLVIKCFMYNHHLSSLISLCTYYICGCHYLLISKFHYTSHQRGRSNTCVCAAGRVSQQQLTVEAIKFCDK